MSCNPSEESRSSPSSSAMWRRLPPLGGLALEQAVAALELVDAGGGHGRGARLAVDAAVDRPVGLARTARDGRDERAPLVAQALPALVGGLPGGPRGAGGGGGEGEEGGRRRGGGG